MRISLVFLGTTGGGPPYSYEMARALAESGRCHLQVIISEDVCNMSRWKETFENSDVDFHVVKTYKRSKLSVFLNTFNLKRKYAIYKLIRDFQTDVLYSPFVLMWERFLFGMMHGKARVVKTIHDMQLHDSFRCLSDFFTVVLNYGSMHYVDDIVLLNSQDQQRAQQRYGKPTVLIPHACLDYNFSAQRSSYHVRNTIGFFGRIEPYKGLDLLVEAFERSANTQLKLLIAGKGIISKPLLERINANPRITLRNEYIRDEEFPQLLEAVDLVVLPYKRASQSGVIPMCFAAGVAVVATNVGALAEQVPEGTGVIVEPDAEAVARAIDSFYASPDSIRQYGEAAKAYCLREMTWEHSADILLTHLEGAW